MKLAASLLVGAAGIAVTGGAQAADLPVKAKPIEYVRICSLYGAGFYYIPGTDTCLRIGGELRAEYNFGDGNSGYAVPYFQRNGIPQDTRDRNSYHFRARAYMNMDARQQTAYGTLRSFVRIRFQAGTTDGLASNSATAVTLESAIIQWAGFSFGRSATSYMHDPFQYGFKYNTVGAPGVTDNPTGRNVIAYTHQFGNGLSGTIALEDSKDGLEKLPIYNANNTLHAVGTAAGVDTSSGTTFPDIVGQLRLDQAWGGWFLGGVLHNNKVAYGCNGTPQTAGCTENLPAANAPSSKVGFAVNSSIKINVPTGPGDAVYIGGGFAKGAVGYVLSPLTQGSAFGYYGGTSNPAARGSIAFGSVFDSVYNVNAAGVVTADQQLTSAYGGYLAYEHAWNPEWKTSVFGGAQYLDYNATANALLCSRLTGAAAAGPGLLIAAGGCNMDMMSYQAGSRTVWSPVKDLTLGVEFIYSRLEPKNDGALFVQNHQNGFLPAGTYEVKDQNIFSGLLSVRRFF